MSLSKLLLIGAILLTGAHLAWKNHAQARREREVLAAADSNGFIDVLMPDGAPPNTVLIFAPINCPSKGARQADAMARRLSEMGIPNIRTSNYSVAAPAPGQTELIKRTFVVLGGEVPAIMVNGVGKANPTVDEVALEYRRAD